MKRPVSVDVSTLSLDGSFVQSDHRSRPGDRYFHDMLVYGTATAVLDAAVRAGVRPPTTPGPGRVTVVTYEDWYMMDHSATPNCVVELGADGKTVNFVVKPDTYVHPGQAFTHAYQLPANFPGFGGPLREPLPSFLTPVRQPEREQCGDCSCRVLCCCWCGPCLAWMLTPRADVFVCPHAQFPQGDVITIFVLKSRIIKTCAEPLETMKITGVIEWSHVVDLGSTKVAARLCLVNPKRQRVTSRITSDVVVEVDYCHLRRHVPINNGDLITEQSAGVWWFNRSTWVTGNMTAVMKEAGGRGWLNEWTMQNVSPTVQHHRVRLWEVDTTVELPSQGVLAAYRVGHINDGDVHEGVVPGVTMTASDATSGHVEPEATFHGAPSTTFTRLGTAVPVSKMRVILSHKPIGRQVVWIDVELQPEVVDVGLQPEVVNPGQQGTNISRRSSSTLAQRGRAGNGTAEKSGASALPDPRQSARMETRRPDVSANAGPAPDATARRRAIPSATTGRGLSGLDILAAVTAASDLDLSPAQPFVPTAPAAKKPRLDPPVNEPLRFSAGTVPGDLAAVTAASDLDLSPAQPFVPTAPAAKKPRLDPPVNEPLRFSAGTVPGDLAAVTASDPAAPAAKKPRLEGRRDPPVNKLLRLAAGTGFGDLPALVFPDVVVGDPQKVLAGEHELVSTSRIGRALAKACTNLVWAYQDLRDREHTTDQHALVVKEYMAAHAVCSSTSVSRENELKKYMAQPHLLRRLTPYVTRRDRAQKQSGMHAQVNSEELKTFVTTRGLSEPALLEYCTTLESTDDPHSLNEYKNKDGKLGTARPNTKHLPDPVLVTSRRQCNVARCTFFIGIKVYEQRVDTTAHPHHSHVVGSDLQPGSSKAKRTFTRLVRRHLANHGDLGKCTQEKMWEYALKTFRPGSGRLLGDMDLLQWPQPSTDQDTADIAVAFQHKVMQTLASCKKTVAMARRKAGVANGHTKTDGLISPQQSAAITKELVAVLKDWDKETVLADKRIEYHQRCYALETTEDAVTSRNHASSRMDAKLVKYHLFSHWFMTRTLLAGARLRHPGGLVGHAASLDHTFNINQANIPAFTLIMLDGAGQALPSGMIQRASSKKHQQVLDTLNAYDKEAVGAECSFFESLRVFMSDNDPTFKKAMVLAAAARGSRVMGQLEMIDLETGDVVRLVWGLGGSNYDPDRHACGVVGAAESTLNGRDATMGTSLVECQCGVHARRRQNSGTWGPMQHPPPGGDDLIDSIWGDDAGSDEEGEPEPTLGPKSKRKMAMCDQRPFLLAIDVLVKSSRDCTTFFYMLGLFVEEHESVWRYQIAGWLAGRYGKFGWMWWWSFIFNNTQAGEHYHSTAKDYIVKVAENDDDVVLDGKGRLPVASDARTAMKMLTDFYAPKFSRGTQVARHHYDWENLGRYRKDQAMDTCDKASGYIKKLLMLEPTQHKLRPKKLSESHKAVPVVVLPPILPAVADVAQNGDGCASSVLDKAADDVKRIQDEIDTVKSGWATNVAKAGADYTCLGKDASSGDRELLSKVMTSCTDFKASKLAVLEPQLIAATAKVRAAKKEGKGSQLGPRLRAYLPTNKLLRLFEDGKVTREEIIAEAQRQAKAFCGTHHPFAGHRGQEQRDLQHADFDDAAEKFSWFIYVVEDSGWQEDGRCPFVSHSKWFCDHGGIDMYSAVAGMLLVEGWHLPDALTSYQQDTLPSNPKRGQGHRTRPTPKATPIAKSHWCVHVEHGALRSSNDVWGGTPFDPKTFARQQDNVPVKVEDRVTVRFKRANPDPAASDKCSSGGRDVWMEGTVTAIGPGRVTVKYDAERAAFIHEAADFAARRKGLRWDWTTATGSTSAGDTVAKEATKAGRAQRAAGRASTKPVDAASNAVATVNDAASNAVATVNEVATMLADGLSTSEARRRVQNVGRGYCYWCALMDAAGLTITTDSMLAFLGRVLSVAEKHEKKAPGAGGEETAAKVVAAIRAIRALPHKGAWSGPASQQQAHTATPTYVAAMHWGGSCDDAAVAKVLKKRLVVFHTDHADGGADSSRPVQFVSVTSKSGKRTTYPRGSGCAPGSESPPRLTVAELKGILTKLKITSDDAVVLLWLDAAGCGGVNHYEALR